MDTAKTVSTAAPLPKPPGTIGTVAERTLSDVFMVMQHCNLFLHSQ